MQKTDTLSKKSPSTRNILMFAIPSLLGLLLFMTPISFGDSVTIPIAVMASSVLDLLGNSATAVVTALVVLSAVVSVLVTLTKPAVITRHGFLNGLFNISPIWLVTRVFGAVFVAMAFYGIGSPVIMGETTGAFVLNELLPTLLSVFIFAGLLLPLLTSFGLLELLGAILTKVMRPLFGLPGRSAVDCAASWLGDGSVGILMTSKQYEQGFYTQREAAVVGTTFSAVSISFSLVVIAQVDLMHMFTWFYLTVCLAGIAAAIVVPRLPPLCWKKDALIDNSVRESNDEALPEGHTTLSYGLHCALSRVEKIRSVNSVLKEGVQNAIDMVLGVLPVVMAIGTAALMVAEYTDVFSILGTPFVPLLELLHIPDAVKASETMVIGFADMFIPAILAAEIDSEMTRFVIATVSVTQLIYISEVGALLLGSKIPVKLWELFVIFILRTLVTLPVIAGIAHLIF
ncbi:YjiH family protein [Salinivibrio sp. ES.052]|uniref:YjiH family protein n=1 Tax=Salinivibrio sp. ES.052 TaxID=1882823 RepID=UPI00092C9CE4|nr:YjiH family protein [Salinivibrio sp. ES.052]SIN87427.1 nucleoside recognition GATE domain-containing membrane protein YjiH [Salinivibrio sp. ES.052]